VNADGGATSIRTRAMAAFYNKTAAGPIDVLTFNREPLVTTTTDPRTVNVGLDGRWVQDKKDGSYLHYTEGLIGATITPGANGVWTVRDYRTATLTPTTEQPAIPKYKLETYGVSKLSLDNGSRESDRQQTLGGGPRSPRSTCTPRPRLGPPGRRSRRTWLCRPCPTCPGPGGWSPAGSGRHRRMGTGGLLAPFVGGWSGDQLGTGFNELWTGEFQSSLGAGLIRERLRGTSGRSKGVFP
jgi:hypothetical protein